MIGVIYFGIGILGYFLMRTLTGVKLMPLLSDVIHALTGQAVESVDKYRDNIAQEFIRMPLHKKKKSKKYRYYCFVNDILASFGLKEHGINVEGITIAVFLVILVVSIIISLLANNVLYAIFLPLLLAPLVIALAFLGSRVRVRRRKQALLDSMDMICSVMSDGILLAIKNSLGQFPESVQHYFEKFVKNVELLNISIPDAVGILNSDVGSLYDEFCASVINYEESRANGLETIFNFYIIENAQTLERDRKLKRMSDDANMDYFASIGLIAVFGIFANFVMGASVSIWEQPIGKVVLILMIVAAVAIFIYIQYLLSKSFIYTEKK